MSPIAAAFAQARQGLRLRRRRTVLAGLGIALSAAMLSAAVVIAYGLGTGFDRSARAADLPDVIVRFEPKSTAVVAARIRALPDVARFSTRFEALGADLWFAGRHLQDGVVEVLDAPGPRQGYAVVGGRDLRDRGPEVLVERAFADAWGLRVGSLLRLDGLGRMRVVGIVQAPDDVGYPLAKPRVYISGPALDARFGPDPNPQVDYASIWLRDPRFLPEVLVQARATSFGLQSVRFQTRSAVRLLLDQAAGIVIDLLVALSLIALVTAGVMLAASARAEVQRRLGAIGVRRAVGASRLHEALAQGAEGLLVALPFCTLGMLAGALATLGPTGRLLTLLNEPPPGRVVVAPLVVACLACLLLPALGAAWPAWRAARDPVAGLLRGGDVAASGRSRRRPRRSLGGSGSLTVLGARLVGARRVRLVATAVTLGLSTAFILLLLALAVELSTLETDPNALGRRYQLTALLPPSGVGEVRAIPGVQAVAPRYDVTGADLYDLGEAVDVIGYPGDHTVFEAPPLIAGRRLRGSGEAEVGLGLSQALGLSVGSVLALALPGGGELRLRVSGVVSSLDFDGRVAYVPAAALRHAFPSVPFTLAVVVAPSGSVADVYAALGRLGALPAFTAGATARGAPLIAVLRVILRAVAIVDGLVCLYALIQVCALTVQERRATVAVLRACGGGAAAVVRLLAGAALAIVVPAALVGVLLERLVLGPAMSRLAENYAVLPLAAGPVEVGVVLFGLLVAAAAAVVWVARGAARAPVVRGLA